MPNFFVHIQVLEVQVRDLQVELREGNVRVGTLEKMLAQKELQLFNIQEERQALQIERSGLKGELQLLRKQQNSALKETEAHNYKTMASVQIFMYSTYQTSETQWIEILIPLIRPFFFQ